MKIVFFGTGAFGLPTLELLKNSPHQIVSVITSCDKPKGRDLKVESSPVRSWAAKNEIPSFVFTKSSLPLLVEELKKIKPDLFVVIAFGHLLTPRLLEIPKRMTLNVHGSLLPKYRGAAPIHWALADNQKETGVSVIRMVERLDAGDVILQKKIVILPENDFGALNQQLSVLGAEALRESLELIEKDKAIFKPQEEASVTYARKITKTDGHIDWKKAPEEICGRLRAFREWPGSYCFYQGKRLIILEAAIHSQAVPSALTPGTIMAADAAGGICVAARGGAIEIKRLQMEGRKPLSAAEFLKGFEIKKGLRLE